MSSNANIKKKEETCQVELSGEGSSLVAEIGEYGSDGFLLLIFFVKRVILFSFESGNDR